MDNNNKALQDLINNGYEFNISKYIRDGYDLFMKNMGSFIGYFFIIVAIMGISSSIVFLSVPASLVSPVFVAGIFIVANEVMRGRRPDFSMFFKGFNFFIPLLLVSLVSSILITLGLILLIIPGIYLSVGYLFSNLFVVFLGYDFWDAMEASRKIITKKWWSVFGFVLLIGLINILGLLIFGIGIFFTAPATYCMIFCAFEDVVGKAIREDSATNVNDNYTSTII
ncbi:MAG: hypothetical protein LBQ22_12300 [Bacteroidales bacterium]|jgi:hypothetical protein|nr:hypothetical protein [Bacteroidales bacterium]